MKNYRTPRSSADAEFTVGREEKRFTPPHVVHTSTWFILALGLIGLGIVLGTL